MLGSQPTALAFKTSLTAESCNHQVRKTTKYEQIITTMSNDEEETSVHCPKEEDTNQSSTNLSAPR